MIDLRKKVSREELKKSLRESIEKNSEALDYVKNRIPVVENLVNYNSEDSISRDELRNLKYIELTLNYLHGMYEDSLKKI